MNGPGDERLGLLEGLLTTRAIRRFRDEPVTDEQLATILFAATRAPSGSNRQPFRFLILRDGEPAATARRLLAAAARDFWSAKRSDDGYERGSGVDPSAPKARLAQTMDAFVEGFEHVPAIILAALVRYRPEHAGEGASVYPACQNLLLAARAVGLGGVLTQWHSLCEPALREALQVPDEVALHATIALGHPAGRHGPVRRRPLGELVYEGAWGDRPAWAVDPPGAEFTQAGPPR